MFRAAELELWMFNFSLLHSSCFHQPKSCSFRFFSMLHHIGSCLNFFCQPLERFSKYYLNYRATHPPLKAAAAAAITGTTSTLFSLPEQSKNELINCFSTHNSTTSFQNFSTIFLMNFKIFTRFASNFHYSRPFQGVREALVSDSMTECSFIATARTSPRQQQQWVRVATIHTSKVLWEWIRVIFYSDELHWLRGSINSNFLRPWRRRIELKPFNPGNST